MTTLEQLRQTLDSVGELYGVLPLQNDASILLTQRGARVLGLFAAPDADNLLWTNAALENPNALREFIKAGGWNLGGERCWIAPEIQYNVRDRNDFWGTLHVPAEIDPGVYTMTVTGGRFEFQQQVRLTAYNTATGEKSLAIRRTVSPVANPVDSSHLCESLMRGVSYAGYGQTATISELDSAPIASEVWNLVQLNAGGQLIIPCTPGVEASDYFGTVPDEARTVHDGHYLRLNITGQQQYKVGYKAAFVTGRMGYWNRLPDGRAYLLVRQFFNNPSSIYAEEPPDQPGQFGHSVHVYNDGGQFGAGRGFGEMECSGQTIGGRSGQQSSTDHFILWAYVGEPEAVRRIALVLLGVPL